MNRKKGNMLMMFLPVILIVIIIMFLLIVINIQKKIWKQRRRNFKYPKYRRVTKCGRI